jgi:hypothetical protein
MADVTRAMEKAQEAISKITSKAAGDRDGVDDFVALAPKLERQ